MTDETAFLSERTEKLNKIATKLRSVADRHGFGHALTEAGVAQAAQEFLSVLEPPASPEPVPEAGPEPEASTTRAPLEPT